MTIKAKLTLRKHSNKKGHKGNVVNYMPQRRYYGGTRGWAYQCSFCRQCVEVR